ncbi:MAG: NUDIX domain-containing protein [Acidobacteriota bacterium]|nr:MAG: NUDIX domain-containing protein [Acidobacteriota bacterium]
MESIETISLKNFDDWLERKVKEQRLRHGSPPGYSKTSLLDEVYPLLGIGKSTYYESLKKEECCEISQEVKEQILEIVFFGSAPANPVQETEAWRPEKLIKIDFGGGKGDPNKGEIEIMEFGGNRISKDDSPVDRYVSVFVDKVNFRQYDKELGKAVVKPGNFVRIESPGGEGAVILVCDSQSGDICLVTQWRHSIRERRWLTEAPRGFASRLDRSMLDTALREMGQETTYQPMLNDGEEMIQRLKCFYTDTGKLSDKPGYFLAFVDRDKHEDRMDPVVNPPVRDDPVWIPLRSFYQAIFARTPIQIGDEVEFVFVQHIREEYFAEYPLAEEGELEICDGFTALAGLLAFPYLAKYFRNKTGWDDKKWRECFTITNYLPAL